MKVNGQEYENPVLNFKALCELEKDGINLNDVKTRPLGFLAGFVGLAVGGGMAAGQEAIEQHLTNGGTLDDFTDALDQAVEASGFFTPKGTKAKTQKSRS